MLAPSKATLRGVVPTTKVPSTAPSLARSLVTLLPLTFVTQMLAPSKASAKGLVPTIKVPSTAPSLARNLATLAAPPCTIQMLAPSKAISLAPPGIAKVPNTAPSLARNLLTLLLFWFATQMLAPSTATPAGPLPTANLVAFLAAYHFSSATCWGLIPPPTNWLGFRLVSPDPSPVKAVAVTLPLLSTLKTSLLKGACPLMTLPPEVFTNRPPMELALCANPT